jgi:hypothetical protein
MPLSPEQSLALSQFTEFEPLVNEYIDEFAYRVLFDPTNPAVSDFTPTTAERDYIKQMWDGLLPRTKQQLAKIIKFVAVDSQNTAGDVIRLLRLGNTGTTNVLYNVFKAEIPKLVAELTPAP